MPRPSARHRLLDCAEELFAAHGVEGVSLRAINAGAGLSPAALHYHFGSKEALVEALLERRMALLMARRGELLDALEHDAGTPHCRGLVHALVAPLAELLAREGESGRRYLRLLSRLVADRNVDERFVVARFGRGIERLEPLLQRALPDLPIPVVRLRLALVIELMLRSLAQWDTLAGTWRGDQPPLSLDAFVASLLDVLTGALEAPDHTGPILTASPADAHTHGDEA